MDKKSLGKGLSALLSSAPVVEQNDQISKGARGIASMSTPAETIREIPVSRINLNTVQPRQDYDDQKLTDLMTSIQERGVLQPILVRPAGDDFEVVAGERRLRAAKKLGLDNIPVVVKLVNDDEALVIALVENIQREELNPIEEAQGYRRLIHDFGLTQDAVAKSVGKNRSTVTNMLRLLTLPTDIQQAVFDGKLSTGHARALISIEDDYLQRELFAKTLQKGLTVRDVEDLVKSANNADTSSTKKRVKKDREIELLEEELQQRLGTRVQLSVKKNNKGKLVIDYYSLDDLDRILTILRK